MTQVRQHPSQPLRKAVAPVLAQIVRPDQVCRIVHRRYCATPPLNGQNAPSPARNAFPRVTPCAVAPLRQPSTPAGRRPSSRPNRPPGPALSSSPSPVPCGCTFERSERPIARAKRLPARHASRRCGGGDCRPSFGAHTHVRGIAGWPTITVYVHGTPPAGSRGVRRTHPLGSRALGPGRCSRAPRHPEFASSLTITLAISLFRQASLMGRCVLGAVLECAGYGKPIHSRGGVGDSVSPTVCGAL